MVWNIRLRGWVVLVLLAMLVGCGTPVTPPPAPTNSVAPLTLFLWHGMSPTEQRVIAGLVEQFNQANPDLVVVAQSRPLANLTSEMRQAVSEGRGPHLALVPSHTLGTLVAHRAIGSLDGLIAPEELARLIPASLGSAQLRQPAGAPQLFGLPLSYDTPALFYNRANWRIAPQTTDVWLEGGRALSDPTGSPPLWGLAFHLSLERSLGYLYAHGATIFDDEGTLVLTGTTRSEAEQWLTWLSSLRNDPQILVSLDRAAVDNALLAQRALSTIDWSHSLATYQALWGDALGVAPLPLLSSSGQAPQAYVQTDLLVMSSLVREPRAQAGAARFMGFLLSEPSQRALLAVGRQPVRNDLEYRTDDPVEQIAFALREQARRGIPMPNGPDAARLRMILDEMQLSVLRGLASPNQALDQAAAALNQLASP